MKKNVLLISVLIIALFIIYFMVIKQNTIRYVALGDSYTIGTGADEDQAWPVVLTNHLKQNNVTIELVANAAQSGWTTREVIDYELPILMESKPSFVTLLIGTNDWAQGMSEQTFHENLVFIIEKVQKQLPNKKNLVLITIPDFSATPGGSEFGDGRDISKGLSEFNKLIIQEAQRHNLKTIDLFEKSKILGKNNLFISDDGLHPSAKGYAEWEKLIYPVVFALLK